jgi:PhnB protein
MPTPQIIPYLFYSDLPAALDWLSCAFGFNEVLRVATPNGGMHAQMKLGDQLVMMGSGAAASGMTNPRDGGCATAGVFVYLDDVDAHHARAVKQGAEIVHPPKNVEYGRTYAVYDLERHPWFFTTPPAPTPG